MKAATYALMLTRPWLVPDPMGVVFRIPRWCIHKTDQRTEERKWTAKKQHRINFDNLVTFLCQMFDRIIKPNFYTGGTTMGRGGFGLRYPIEILRCLQTNFGTPSAQEEEDATVWFTLPMDQYDPPGVMMFQIEETQLFFLAHPEGSRGYTDIFEHMAISMHAH